MIDSSSRGFVIARRERGEADLSLDLLLDDGQLRRAYAKSATRSTKRFSGALGPFTLYRFRFGRGGQTAGSRLDEAVVERVFPGLISELRRSAAAGVATVMARELAAESLQDVALFELYLETLAALEHASETHAGGELVRYVIAAFVRAGHPFVIDGCVRCGRSAPDNARVQLSPTAGGVVCGPCGGGPIDLLSAERRSLRAILDGNVGLFDRAMLSRIASIVRPHTPRTADALVSSAPHWRESPASHEFG